MNILPGQNIRYMLQALHIAPSTLYAIYCPAIYGQYRRLEWVHVTGLVWPLAETLGNAHDLLDRVNPISREL